VTPLLRPYLLSLVELDRYGVSIVFIVTMTYPEKGQSLSDNSLENDICLTLKVLIYVWELS